MRKLALLHSVALSLLLLVGGMKPAWSQDSENSPLITPLDTTSAPYSILVDSSLPQDNPAAMQFTTLQAAYAAAPAGTATQQTVIGIKPGVYQITGTATTPGLTITKNYITLLGLTDNLRNVVLADNRGNEEGAGTATNTNDGYVIVVSATGFRAINLTIVNYCNLNYEYPGDSSKNLTERSSVITQAVALQASGDQHVYDHVALLSRLDTSFIETTRAYFTNVYIEGTDDFIGGGTISVWNHSVINFPTGSGVPSVNGTVFVNTTFTLPSGGTMQFDKSFPEGSGMPPVLINCVLPVNTGQSVAWVRGYASARQNLYALTYQNTDSNGNPAVIADGSSGPITFNLSRELSPQEAEAFNPWNLLRATPTGVADNWDPAGVEAQYDGLGEGSLPFAIAMTNASPSIITGQTTATVNATVRPARVPNNLTWSTSSNLVSLSPVGSGSSVVVSGNNNTGISQYVPINATASNGFYTTAWVFVQPPFINPPTLASPATFSAPFNGTVTVSYNLNLPPNRTDQSIITWYSCADTSCGDARAVAISNGNIPLTTYTLQQGDVGRYLEVSIQPKVDISNPGPAVSAVATTPIAISDIKTTTVSPDFMNFPPTAESSYVSGYWTVLGTWTSEAAPAGSTFVNSGWGLRVGSQGAALLYQQDAAYGDMQEFVIMAPEKTAGQGFGSPGSGADSNPPTYVQNADIYIKYDPRSGNGYSLRWWRTTASATDCLFQLYQHVNGVGSPISATQVLTGAFKPNTYLTLSIIGTTFTVSGYNDSDGDTLFLQGTVTPNSYGGAGTRWSGTVPSGNSNVYTFFQLSYPGTVQLVTTAQLTSLGGSGYQAKVTVTNNGTAIAQNVALNGATLGNANGTSLPVSLGSIAPGASQTATINFPSSAGASGAATVEKFTGIYTGGSFQVSVRGKLP